MSKPKKESRPFSIRMATEVYERMEDYCAETGVPKTTIIEKAIAMYIDDYEAKKMIIEKEKGWIEKS